MCGRLEAATIDRCSGSILRRLTHEQSLTADEIERLCVKVEDVQHDVQRLISFIQTKLDAKRA